MRGNSRTDVYRVLACITLLLPVYSDADSRKLATGTAMLQDDDKVAAPHALIRLQERPVFHRDDKKRPYAMIGDSDERAKREAKPMAIQETKPR